MAENRIKNPDKIIVGVVGKWKGKFTYFVAGQVQQLLKRRLSLNP